MGGHRRERWTGALPGETGCEVGKSGRPRPPLGCPARFWPRSKWRVLRTHVGCVELGGLLNVWWKYRFSRQEGNDPALIASGPRRGRDEHH